MNEAILSKLTNIETLMRISQKNALDINECALYLGITVGHLRHLCADRIIPHYKRGLKLYFDKTEIDSWKLSERIPTNEEIERIAQSLY